MLEKAGAHAPALGSCYIHPITRVHKLLLLFGDAGFVKNWAERTSPSPSLRLQRPASLPLTAFRNVDPGHSQTPSPLSFYSTVSCLSRKLPPCSLEHSGQRLSLIHVYLAGVSQKAPNKFNSIAQPPVLKVSWGKSKAIYIARL